MGTASCPFQRLPAAVIDKQDAGRKLPNYITYALGAAHRVTRQGRSESGAGTALTGVISWKVRRRGGPIYRAVRGSLAAGRPVSTGRGGMGLAAVTGALPCQIDY